MTPKRFLELMQAEGLTVSVQKQHVVLEGNNATLIRRGYAFLTAHHDFEAAVIKLMDAMTLSEYLHELQVTGLNYHVENGRVILKDGTEKARSRCTAILEQQPELEARLILMRALNDSDLLDAIQERACIRWSNGYSDSLISAVLCNITTTDEVRSKELLPRSDWTAELSSLSSL